MKRERHASMLVKCLKPALALSALLVLANCSVDPAAISNTGGNGIQTPGTFTAVYNQTLSTNCAVCHKPGSSAYDISGVELDFSSKSAAYSTLTTKFVTGNSSQGTCGPVRIVYAGAPQASFLAGVLIASYNTNNFAGVSGCQPYTAHLSDQNLSADEESSLIQWIQGGALNN